MYLHKTKNGHYTPPCCYFSGELEVVEILRSGLCSKLGSLLTLLMEQSWHPESVTVSRKRMELATVKEYLDEHYTEKIMLALKYRWSDPIKQK